MWSGLQPDKIASMPYNALRRGRQSLAHHAYHVTFVTDGRQPLFADFTLACLMARELARHGRNGSVETFAWVVMPDHVHWLFALDGVASLSDVVAGLKGRTARAINAARGRSGRIWQPGFHDHAMRADEDLRRSARYIVANPIRAGLVETAAEYAFWDAAWV